MAIRINRNGETIYGQYSSGDVIINLPPNQENLLLEGGIATLLEEGELQIVLAGSGGGSGGSGGGSGGYDLTNATAGTDGILTYTIGGVPWVVTYSSGVPVREALFDVSTLGADLVDAGGGNYIVAPADPDPIYFQGGELRMTLAQRNTWTASNGGNPTIGNGFKVFVTDVGQLIDASGTSIVPGASCVWCGATLKWRWCTPVVYAAYQAGTTINNASGALAISRQLDLPAGLAGSYDQVFFGATWILTGTAGARALQVRVGSVNVYNNASLAATNPQTLTLIKLFSGIGPSAQLMTGVPSAAFDTGGSINLDFTNAAVTSALDMTLAQSVTARATVASGDTAICRVLAVSVGGISGIFG